MISAPVTGCCSSSLASKASAGGQLEQPSDVNSSRTTGTLAPGLLALAALTACGDPDPDWQAAAKMRARTGGSKCDECFIFGALGAAPAVDSVVGLMCFDGRNLDCIPRKML